ncbi:MAG: nucleotidyltransferase domain-containing protein [Myxococcota bacterium]|jgi:predicted nucleotidyltransferase
MIDLAPEQLALVLGILEENVPECEVRAFGSRAGGTPKPYSDLDLALVGTEALDRGQLARLREAFQVSTLQIRVDIVDWHRIDPTFRAVIEKHYVVLRPRR